MRVDTVINYLDFDVDKFLGDHDEKLAIAKSLHSQLEELDGVRAVDTSRTKVQTSGASDPNFATTVARENLREKIKPYEEYLDLFDEVMGILTPDEREVLEQFYGNRKGNLEMRLMDIGISRRTAFRIKKRALQKITKYMKG